MSTLKPASWSYAEDFVPEPEVMDRARARGLAFEGAPPVGTGAGATLRLLAAAVAAKHVIEIGTGAGTSGLLPIPEIPLPAQQPFIKLVDKILENKKSGKDTTALEHQIDVMVYHLYGLSYEEACVVDNSLSKEDFELYKIN